nr:tagaturonate reductase [Pseudomaricurvus alcaniphilus]
MVAAPLRPEKIVQFGTGNFLKGFIDWIVQRLNDTTDLDAGIVAVKLRRGNEAQIDEINQQDGLFTLNIRGLDKDQLVDDFELVSSQNRALSPYQDFAEFMRLAELPELQWVISNTTEAGIQFAPNDRYSDSPPDSFPAKLTLLLHRRYTHFNADSSKGLSVFCCELIDNNAAVLRGMVLRYAELWQLEPGFNEWLQQSCHFYNTLVDRIVTGKPSAQRSDEIQQQLGYRDSELIETERYYQWVIEASSEQQATLQSLFPTSAGLNIVLTDNLNLFRQRKVRILNGAHTGCVSPARLLGVETVYQGTRDEDLSAYMQHLVFEEICPTINLPADDVIAYADAILERFRNPFLHHEWTSIGLNSLSKWRARLLPVLLDLRASSDRMPQALVTSLASLLLLYRGQYEAQLFSLQDDPRGLELLQQAWQQAPDIQAVARAALSATELWGANLADDAQLLAAVADTMQSIRKLGLRKHLRQLLAGAVAVSDKVTRLCVPGRT